jgi:hypothetical protein
VSESDLDRAIEEWGKGEHYEAHELLEDFAESLQDDRDVEIALALVHVAASLHKAINDVGRSAVPAKLSRALAVLDGAHASWQGLDLASLRQGLHGLMPQIEELARGERQRIVGPIPVLERAAR